MRLSVWNLRFQLPGRRGIGLDSLQAVTKAAFLQRNEKKCGFKSFSGKERIFLEYGCSHTCAMVK